MLLALARAKINLALEVRGRRPDGYHEIVTVLQSIELADVLTFAPAEGGLFLEVSGEPVPKANNLVLRAAECLRQATGYRGGAFIRLQKNIPVAAGLGGGSADAAATLVALNRLWRLGCPEEFLERLGAEIGVDIPFCLRGGTALGRGRGDELTSLPSLPALGVLLVKPFYGLATAAVYQEFDLHLHPPRYPAEEVTHWLYKGEWRLAVKSGGNMLEEVVFRRHPELRRLKEELLVAGAFYAGLSGTGPTLFALFPSWEEALDKAPVFAAQGWRVWVTTTARRGIRLFRGENDAATFTG
ncbi:4-(cytidine 5'-diphospho)-2-C-methyl-D-erythritol kinase [Ammonifex thiophilus]|uniref:4-diphosphocytidyl-2-C-methyl-D-erythritol kinase n=1 Tax=Ammonifex thiophilus TaxID=444093 RepID=A0A3D8P7W3_9THEO|nr:4-(cytidine 5'-diphospho)-2-C-methyl-D-erythritol kinase [Ammonifex thiophilus]RDV84625.1 4-(cytidine 5'-diphospho)-2-C-methyl-D-erythritol kinase [Ammonifex thiophilus]